MTTTTCPRARRPLPAWAKALLWTSGVLTVSTVAVVLWLLSVLSGGLDDLLASGPARNDPQVEQARTAAAPVVASAAADLTTALPLRGTGLRADADQCETGQHNWKIDDDWDLDCSLVRTDVLVADRADLTAFAARVDAQLVDAGWTPVTSLVEGLRGRTPEALYTRGGTLEQRAAGVTTLSLRLAERPASGDFSSYDVGLGGFDADVTLDGRRADPEQAAATVEAPAVLVVTTSSRYYFG